MKRPRGSNARYGQETADDSVGLECRMQWEGSEARSDHCIRSES